MSEKTAADERAFDAAMLRIFKRAKDEVGYYRESYWHMLRTHRGVETARALLNSPLPSDGFTELWLRGRLDLTVEALVLQPEWGPLFAHEPDLLQAARDRIAQGAAIQMPKASNPKNRRTLNRFELRKRSSK